MDPAKLQTVQSMIEAPNHKENMPQIVKTILEFAFLTYSGDSSTSCNVAPDQHVTQPPADLPKGPIKGNSMKKLAAKVSDMMSATG